MRLTWFGEKFWRIHLAGQIIVVSDGTRVPGVDPQEVTAGADLQIDLTESAPPNFDLATSNRTPKRLIDDTPDPELQIAAFAGGVALIAPGEPALFVALTQAAEWGRYADGAVIVLVGGDLEAQAQAIFAIARPKLLALAVPEITDADFTAIAAVAGQTAVQLLEPGLALEA